MNTCLRAATLSLAHALNVYTTTVPQLEARRGITFSEIPALTASCEKPNGAEENYTAAYYFPNTHINAHDHAIINIRPDIREGDLVETIVHELGHHHFAEINAWQNWPVEQRDWGAFLSETYAEWISCEYINDCSHRQTGSFDVARLDTVYNREDFFPQMQALFEQGKLEDMMRIHPQTLPPEQEYYAQFTPTK